MTKIQNEEIPHGSKMIKLSIKFWTDKLPTSNKKTAWDSGVVYAMANRPRGIRPIGEVVFNSLTGNKKPTLLQAIVKVLDKHEITLIDGSSAKGEYTILNLNSLLE